MWPCLLIALALLGTVPISRSAVASPAVEDEEDVTELEMPEEYSGCQGGSDKQAPGVPSTLGNDTCHYVVIPHCQSFCHAERICARRFCGHLASIHDCHINTFLLQQVRWRTNAKLVWIGGVCQPAVPCPKCHWTDRSPWNYNYWAPGHPWSCRRFCTALCTTTGRWMSVCCERQLPFICKK